MHTDNLKPLIDYYSEVRADERVRRKTRDDAVAAWEAANGAVIHAAEIYR